VETPEKTSRDSKQTYEAPSLTVIGPANAFTFGSANIDQSDHAHLFAGTGGHKPHP
jgi:hypothetical protein